MRRFEPAKHAEVGQVAGGEGGVELEDGSKANELRRLKVYEFSFVPIGANQDTSIVAVKSAVDALGSWPGFKAGRTLSAKNESALREARDSIDSVLASLADDESGKSAPSGGSDQEKASGTTEVKSGASDEEPSGAKSPAPDEEPKSTPSARVLAAHNHLTLTNRS